MRKEIVESPITIARRALESTGYPLYTASELWKTREDYYLDCAPFGDLLGGTCSAGWRILLGGSSGSGKTTIAKSCIKTHRRVFPDRACLFVDVENAEEGNPHRAAISGWAENDSNIIIMPWSGTGEGLFDAIIKMIQGGLPLSCIVIDSANALVPKAESNGQLDSSSAMASTASMFSKIFRVTTGILAKCHITTVWISQSRQNPGAMGATYHFIGNAMKFYIDIDISFTGGVNSKSMAYKNPFTDEVIGAGSTLALNKKRKGNGTPLTETGIAITFQGGLEEGLNLAGLLASKQLVGTDRQFFLPIEKEEYEKVIEELHSGGQVSADQLGYGPMSDWAKYDDGLLKIAGNKLERIFRAAYILDNSSSAMTTGLELVRSQYEKPRRDIYPGTFTYPTPSQIEALVEELQSAQVVELEDYEAE